MNVATTCLVAGVSYFALVRSLRWRRYNAIHVKYGGRIQSLTSEEAQEIFQVAFNWDMPLLLYYSLAFALFKTYAIVRVTHHFESGVDMWTMGVDLALHITNSRFDRRIEVIGYRFKALFGRMYLNCIPVLS